MSQFSPARTSAPRASWPLFTVPVVGIVLAAVSAFAVFAFASIAGTLALGDSAGPGQPEHRELPRWAVSRALPGLP